MNDEDRIAEVQDASEAGGEPSLASGPDLAVAEETRAKIDPTAYYSTLSFKYEEAQIVHGQIFELRGMPNDSALVGVGHFKEVKEAYPAGAYEHPCVRCGRIFIDDYFKTMHDDNCPPQEVRVEPGTIDLTKNPEATAALKEALGG
jgi:hypothetical protein